MRLAERAADGRQLRAKLTILALQVTEHRIFFFGALSFFWLIPDAFQPTLVRGVWITFVAFGNIRANPTIWAAFRNGSYLLGTASGTDTSIP